MASEIRWKREAILCAALLLVGFVGLPLSIYLIGQRIFGDYAPDQGPLDLVAAIWAELAGLNPAAWLLVASPFLVISLLRISWSAWRSSRRASAD